MESQAALQRAVARITFLSAKVKKLERGDGDGLVAAHASQNIWKMRPEPPKKQKILLDSLDLKGIEGEPPVLQNIPKSGYLCYIR